MTLSARPPTCVSLQRSSINIYLCRPVCRWNVFHLFPPPFVPCLALSSSHKKQISLFSSIDRLLPSTLYHHPPYQKTSTRPNKQISVTIMAGSKFVEILDTSATPYSQANVDLQATIDESRRRSASSGSISSSNESIQSPTSPTPPTTNAQPMKMRLRALSLRRPKKT